MASSLKNCRKYFGFSWLKYCLRLFLNKTIAIAGWLLNFHFPEKYIWKWKLDFLFRRYEKETVSLVKKKIKRGMTIVDVGAHIGYYTRIFSELAGNNGTVYAFEADPENFALLEKNTKHLANVKCYQLAVTDHAGTIDFYHCDEKTGCHSTISELPINLPVRKISVQAADIDSMFAKEQIKSVDLVKIDVEGGEPAVLRGMRKILKANSSIQLVMEFAPAWILAGGVDLKNFLEEITALGFKISIITKDGLEDFLLHKILSPQNLMPEYFVNLYCARTTIKKQY